MGLNVVVIDGIVKSLALRYDAGGKPELRWTLEQADKQWSLYVPCCASGATAERLANAIEEGQHLIITSGQLCSRKRTLKGGEQSRLEMLVWQADVLTTSAHTGAEATTEAHSTAEAPAINHGVPKAVAGQNSRRPRYPKAWQEPWAPTARA